MRGLKVFIGSAALLAGLAMAPAAQAQVYVNVGIQPVCSYGYYDYEPYACAPMGFYGPGYFYNGIFLGMGPWAGWGYGHGWGSPVSYTHLDVYKRQLRLSHRKVRSLQLH